MRSSQSRFEILPLALIEKQNLANDLAALGLLLARKNRERHPAVQNFMLANDSCTVACEVSVYLMAEEIAYYKVPRIFCDSARVARADYRAHRCGAGKKRLGENAMRHECL